MAGSVRDRGRRLGKPEDVKTRVEWHEMKTGVFILQERARRLKAGEDSSKTRWWSAVVGEPVEVRTTIALGGIARRTGPARRQLFLGDGAPWVWNLKQDRWERRVGLLDLFHASQHL